MSLFALLDLDTIIAGMLTQMVGLTKEITDFTEGGVVRSLLETGAIEIQRQNLMVYQGVREGIETGTYKNFSFNRLPATMSGGMVTFTRTSTADVVTIPAGTRVKVPGSSERFYATLSLATFAIGQSALDVPVRCQTSGAAGNTAANTVVEIVDTLGFAVTVTNAAPLLSGIEQESETDRRDRFRRYIAGLSRGTVVALEAAARSVYLTDADGVVTERVTGVLVREPFRESAEGFLGLVEVYVDNGSGSTSQDLLDAVEAVLLGTRSAGGAITPGWLAAGIDLALKSVSAQVLDVVATVTVLPGFDKTVTAAAVQQAITLYLQGLQVFQTAIYAELIAAVMYVDGVSDVSFTTPTGNVVTTFDKRIVPGTVTVSVA